MASSPQAAAGKEGSFAFTKHAEAISRRPSFSETFAAVIVVGGEKLTGRSGFLLKKSSTGRYNKRWFVIHGHYLSYYRTEPVDSTQQPLGALDLWHVLGVSLEDCTITMQLSNEAAEARREEMGKKQLPTTFKRVDMWRRTEIKPKFVVKATSTSEAQAWLANMRESPLLGSSLLGELINANSNTKNAVVDKPTPQSARLTIKQLGFSFGAQRKVLFGEGICAMLGDGVTELLITNLPTTMQEQGGIVEITLQDDSTCLGPFVPSLAETSGVVRFESKNGNKEVQVHWRRRAADAPAIAASNLPLALVTFVGTFVLLKQILYSSLLISALAGTLFACVGFGLEVFHQVNHSNDVVIRNVDVQVKQEQLQEVMKAMAPTMVRPKDPNITVQEANQCDELRARCRDLWNPPVDVDTILKKHDKFLRDWHADLQALKKPEVIKEVMDKHLLEDFRLVRYLRARKHNLNKAEEMVRESLTWRVMLGSDELHENPELKAPEWLMNYIASPRLLNALSTSETRLKSVYGRDREGHLCIFVRLGRLTSRKLYRKMGNKPFYMMKYFLRSVEILRRDMEVLRKATGAETVLTMIFDLDRFAVSEQVSVPDLIVVARKFFALLSTQFPEVLHRVLVFNAPWLFGTLWSAVKPFIPEEVQEKIQIHSGSFTYEKDIERYVAREYVPKYFGGELVDEEDGNPYCVHSVPPFAPYANPQTEGHDLLQGVDPQAATW